MGQLFKQSLIVLLKETQGDIFLKFPDKYRPAFISFIVYCQQDNTEVIRNFLLNISKSFLEHNNLLEKANFMSLLNSLVHEIQKENLLWFKNLNGIQDLFEQVINGIINHRLLSVQNILECVKGNNTQLYYELSKAKIISIGGQEEINEIIHAFKQKNQTCKDVQNFTNLEFNIETYSIYKKIQEEFGRPLHNLQMICIKFVLQNLHRDRYFLNFGLGNGKTLICSTLSIIINQIAKMSVIILIKSFYLLQRDFMKFRSMIVNCGSTPALQQFLKNGITFMDEKMFLQNFKGKINHTSCDVNNTFLIIDEYDSIFEDQKPSQILEKIKVISLFKNIVGLSGSDISIQEYDCLNNSLNSQTIFFPVMHDLNINPLLQKRSQIYQHQEQWLQCLLQLAQDTQQQVPVIIALDQKDITKVTRYFQQKQVSCFDLTTHLKKQQYAHLQTLVDYQFNKKVDNSKYGIYIINQQLGRGTDFPSSVEIENNGGAFLILGDVFNKKCSSQMKGRVNRMQNQGQFLYCVFMKEEGSQHDYIKQKQNILELEMQSTCEKLMNLIREQQQTKQNNEFNYNIKLNHQMFFIYNETISSIEKKYEEQTWEQQCSSKDMHSTYKEESEPEYELKQKRKQQKIKKVSTKKRKSPQKLDIIEQEIIILKENCSQQCEENEQIILQQKNEKSHDNKQMVIEKSQ